MKACPVDVDFIGTWAKKDFAGAVRYMSDANPTVPLTILANSLGARQYLIKFNVLTSLMSSPHRFDAFIPRGMA